MNFLGYKYGYIREWLKGFTRDGSWTITRDRYIEQFPFCECCCTTENLNVHHVYPVRWFPELELEPLNLMTLCRHHHFYYGHLGNWKKWNPYIWEMAQLFHQGFADYREDYLRFSTQNREPIIEDYLKRLEKSQAKHITRGRCNYDFRG